MLYIQYLPLRDEINTVTIDAFIASLHWNGTFYAESSMKFLEEKHAAFTGLKGKPIISWQHGPCRVRGQVPVSARDSFPTIRSAYCAMGMKKGRIFYGPFYSSWNLN